MSNFIIFLNIIPSPFSHWRVTGWFSVRVLLPIILQIEFDDGTFILFPILVQPVSTKYPFTVSWGFKKTTFFLSFKFCLWFLKEISSIIAPFKDREPIILLFSILILLTLLIKASLDAVLISTVWSILGEISLRSVVCLLVIVLARGYIGLSFRKVGEKKAPNGTAWKKDTFHRRKKINFEKKTPNFERTFTPRG